MEPFFFFGYILCYFFYKFSLNSITSIIFINYKVEKRTEITKKKINNKQTKKIIFYQGFLLLKLFCHVFSLVANNLVLLREDTHKKKVIFLVVGPLRAGEGGNPPDH